MNVDDLRVLSSDMTANRNMLRYLADLNESLKEVISVLLLFDTATKCLSADKSVSEHLVLPTRHKLIKTLQFRAVHSAIINQMKTRIMKMVDVYFPVSDLHKTALLLDPRLKDNTTLLTSNDCLGAVESLRHLVELVRKDPR